MKIFVVVRYGVYMQGIAGVYSTKAMADKAVLRAKEREPDDYHEFSVDEFVLDTDNILEFG